jgi:flagellar hook protein FlgE
MFYKFIFGSIRRTLMPSFSIAITGLQANAAALDTIGNNLANLNTTAYKDQSTAFEDLFYQQVGVSGAGDPLLQGVGTKVSSTATSFAQGSLSSTSNATDMALKGDGFFLVEDGNQTELTRAGNFQVSSDGNLTTVDGDAVLGYPSVDGVINQNATLTGITLPVGTNQAAKATSNVTASVNLDSTTTVGGPAFGTSMQVYDSLGNTHTLGVSYSKTGANTWTYSIALPAGDATGTPTNVTGSLTFDSSGKLVSPAGNIQNITFPGLSDGAADLNVNLNLYDATGSPVITQLATTSTATVTNQDGYAPGSYQGFTVDASGIVSATFSNGHTAQVGQVAVGTVVNEQGLLRVGGNNYETTSGSGAVTVGAAGSGGRGSIQDESLEQSNVDISTEFANLIVAQRAFEANSKTVTTFDTVTQDTIGMIR